MTQYQKGDKVRLVWLEENTNPKWAKYLGQVGTVYQPALPDSQLDCTRILFEDGEWFPALPSEIEKVT